MISFPYGRRYYRVSDMTKKEVVDILLNNNRLQEILKHLYRTKLYSFRKISINT